MRTDNLLLEGLHIPLTTPFHPDGRLNLQKLAANVVRYSRTPAAGLIVLGPSGEPTLLSDEETREALRSAGQAAAPEKVLIAGIARDSVHATVELGNFAAEQNYDVLLVGAPSVLAPTQTRELLTWFQTIADRASLPVVLLSTASRALAAETIAILAAHPNIVGLLDTAGADSVRRLVQSTVGKNREVTVTHVFAAVTRRMQKAASRASTTLVSAGALTGVTTAVVEPGSAAPLRTRTKTVGFQILAANTAQMLDGLNAGAAGIAPAFAACAPQACYEVFAAWKDQDQPLASEKQQRLIEAAGLAELLGPAALKYAADLNGYFGGVARLPHLPLSGEQRAAIERLMKPICN